MKAGQSVQTCVEVMNDQKDIIRMHSNTHCWVWQGVDGVCSDFLEVPTALLNSGSHLSLDSADGHSNLSARVRQLTERVQLIVTGGHGMPCVRKWHPTIIDVDKRYGVN